MLCWKTAQVDVRSQVLRTGDRIMLQMGISFGTVFASSVGYARFKSMVCPIHCLRPFYEPLFRSSFFVFLLPGKLSYAMIDMLDMHIFSSYPRKTCVPAFCTLPQALALSELRPPGVYPCLMWARLPKEEFFLFVLLAEKSQKILMFQ